jgi:hypothetical protein
MARALEKGYVPLEVWFCCNLISKIKGTSEFRKSKILFLRPIN